jgi:hypothetical protein
MNHELKISSEEQHQHANEDSYQFAARGDTQYSSKQKQKKRSKGQKLDSQLLGFTVQPDPNLKNRGDIEPL